MTVPVRLILLLLLRSADFALAQGSQNQASHILQLPDSASAQDVDGLCARISAKAADGQACLTKYYVVLKGVAAKLTDSQAKQWEADPLVVAVHDNPSTAVHAVPVLRTQRDAPWGLDRIDQKNLPLDANYNYLYDGSGVNVYVLDTGIRRDHADFQTATGSRVFHGFSAYGDNDSNDCNGHGTHVAGTIGGRTYGVAKNVTMYAVRVIRCNAEGSVSDMIAGLDWIGRNAVAPAMASMSIVSSRPSIPLDEALRKLISLGLPAIVAAGNYNDDACNYSPGRIPEAVTAGASDITDRRWSMSNYGRCVDIMAPGVEITSAYFASVDGKLTATGTSMAAPHVAGVVALYLQQKPSATVEEVRTFVRASSIDIVDNNNLPERAVRAGASPTNLLHVALAQLPVLTYAPTTLAPVTLFSDSSQTVQSQVITITNAGATAVNFNVSITPRSFLFADRVRIANSTGVIPAQGAYQLAVEYNVQQLSFTGIYVTDIVITTDGQPVVMSYAAQVNVFCNALRAVPAAATHSVNSIIFDLVQETRPQSWNPAPATGPSLYFEAQVLLSHPVADLSNAAVIVNEKVGIIESILPAGGPGAYCGAFTIQGRVPIDPWKTRSTTVCVTMEGDAVTDIYGGTFPDAKNCSGYDHRPLGKLLVPYMAYSAEDGVTTSSADALIIAVFSEPVSGMDATVVAVSPSATVSGLKKVRGTDAYYQFQVSIPATYYGPVQVALSGNIQDAASQAAFPVTPLNFTRVEQPLIQNTAYRLLPPQVLVSTT